MIFVKKERKNFLGIIHNVLQVFSYIAVSFIYYFCKKLVKIGNLTSNFLSYLFDFITFPLKLIITKFFKVINKE